jgi:hypothetical protein
VFEWLRIFPPWLLAGLVLGGVLSALVAAVFVVGGRLFPDDPAPPGSRVDGTVRRRAEIRQFLLDAGERFREEFAVEGERVAFYLPDREVAITFDAQAYFRLERAGVYVVLCEHEMPGHQLGRRLPFEVAEVTRQPDDPVAAAFERLGIDPTDDADAVQSAYRRRIKEAHPDHGGDREEFRAVREAYATARNYAD